MGAGLCMSHARTTPCLVSCRARLVWTWSFGWFNGARPARYQFFRATFVTVLQVVMSTDAYRFDFSKPIRRRSPQLRIHHGDVAVFVAIPVVVVMGRTGGRRISHIPNTLMRFSLPLS